VTKPSIRWRAPDFGELSLADALDRVGASKQLLLAGSVFVNGSRATHAEQRLSPGDWLEVYPALPTVQRARIVERRDGLLVIEKPAALASEPTRQGAASVAEQVAAELGRNVHLHSRLDVGVSGLLVASTSRAARAHVDALRAKGQLERVYLGMSSTAPATSTGDWQASVTHHGKSRAARTRYQVLATLSRPAPLHTLTLLELEPVTGRTHQLRQHCAQHGVPLIGDRRYGGTSRLVTQDGSVLEPGRILLHAACLTLSDLGGRPWRVTLPSPELERFWQLCGGDSAAFRKAWA